MRVNLAKVARVFARVQADAPRDGSVVRKKSGLRQIAPHGQRLFLGLGGVSGSRSVETRSGRNAGERRQTELRSARGPWIAGSATARSEVVSDSRKVP